MAADKAKKHEHDKHHKINKEIAVLGTGNMGTSLLLGIIKAGLTPPGKSPDAISTRKNCGGLRRSGMYAPARVCGMPLDVRKLCCSASNR